MVTRRKSSISRQKISRKSLTPAISLNDDSAEKESRRQSNYHNSKRHSLMVVAQESLKNPNQNAPILANFEQWMKLVKDNKINATNSWNFALIDYFHDMSLLKEGDGINFQRASYTLDGCVKIYTSRVDSVATETGKLLSGLAESANNRVAKNGQRNDGNDEDEDDGDLSDSEGGRSAQKKQKRRKHAESTLAKDFDQLQAKKLDLELSIDPLFRKMCADFDEGGVKGLLLSSLVTDKTGRVVFDGEADSQSEDEDEENDEDADEAANKEKESEDEDLEMTDLDKEKQLDVDISQLREMFLPDLAAIDTLEVCPSIASIHNALNDPLLSGSSIMKEIGVEEEESPPIPETGNDLDVFDNDDVGDIGDIGAFEGMTEDDGLTFGDANTVMNHDGVANSIQNSYSIAHTTTVGKEKDIMSYFDETLRKNWAGPEHWKIQKLKATSLLADTIETQPKKRSPKEKEPLYIDFMDEDGDIDESVLFAEGGASINIPKSQWKTKTRNLLPDDRHFSSKNLVKLFIKPKGKIQLFGQVDESAQAENEDPDEHFWAKQYEKPEEEPKSNYDANFFQDDDNNGPDIPDDMGGADYGDANDDDDDGMFGDYDAPLPDDAGNDTGTLKDQLLTAGKRARPEYVNYAKTAKRVNVRLLKDNIWNNMKLEEDTKDKPELNEDANVPEAPEAQAPEIKSETKTFSEVVRGLKRSYNPQQLSEISTSFCFICVLHLANEKGLVIDDNEAHDELTIRKDPNYSESKDAS
ncbi:condensin complex subunit 2 [Trichomonascus vanleenenianus]|uniref:condensin subunit BRN1 n=1 Tax=Trichomonascus vanleenenianus TaxID=2268995 RepID=UPI003ECB0BEF